jgi:hypothetical protein
MWPCTFAALSLVASGALAQPASTQSPVPSSAAVGSGRDEPASVNGGGPMPALAPQALDSKAPSTPPVFPDVGPRALFVIAGQAGGSADQMGGQSAMNAAGVGLSLRAGAQLSDLFGLEVEGSLGFTGFLSGEDYFRAALTFDVSPSDVLTVGLGPFVRHDDGPSSGIFTNESDDSIGGTLRVDFHLRPTRYASGRKGFVLSLALDLGSGSYTLSSGGFGAGQSSTGGGLSAAGFVAFGWEWY